MERALGSGGVDTEETEHSRHRRLPVVAQLVSGQNQQLSGREMLEILVELQPVPAGVDVCGALAQHLRERSNLLPARDLVQVLRSDPIDGLAHHVDQADVWDHLRDARRGARETGVLGVGRRGLAPSDRAVRSVEQ